LEILERLANDADFVVLVKYLPIGSSVVAIELLFLLVPHPVADQYSHP
jgi:hypothetical protein